MLSLYKYINRPYDQSLVSKGEILIRPLNEFKNQEKFGEKIGDNEEGMVRFTPNGVVFDSADSYHNASFANLISNNIKADRIIIDAEQHIDIHTQNCFIFSVSQILDSNLQKEFGYDSCVKISPFEDFFQILTKNMEKSGLKIKQAVVNECIYQNKVVGLDQELALPPAFLKDCKYSTQREVRCAWIIEDVDEKPLILKYPDIRQYCSIVKL